MNKSPRATTLAHDNTMQRRSAALLGLAILMVSGFILSGCNTTAGAGQDVRATGAAITRSADDVKAKM